MAELKQLNFVDHSARSASELAEHVYCRVRGLVPGFLLSPVEFTESKVTPLISKAQALCYNVLVDIDNKVDYVQTKSQDMFKVHIGEKGTEEFQEAKNKYVAVAKDMYQFFREHGIIGTASAVVHNRGEAFEHIKTTFVSALGATASGVQATAENLANKPAVQKAVGAVKPYADVVHAKYAQLHCSLIHNPTYAALYKFCSDVFIIVSGNQYVKTAYEKTEHAVYPYIQFVADPALEKASPYVEALKEHLQPAINPDEAAKEVLPPSVQSQNGGNSAENDNKAPDVGQVRPLR